MAPHKTVDPCWCMVFLGIELDTAEIQARLPMEKNERYGSHVEDVLQKSKVTLKELQSVIVQLQYATCIILPGRAFLR